MNAAPHDPAVHLGRPNEPGRTLRRWWGVITGVLVAAIFTEFTYRSHAHVILESFLEPYLFNGKRTDPGVEVVSFFADQTPKGHMTEDVAREYKIPVFKTIDGALW